MSAPVAQPAQTPYVPYNFGRLVELALRETGVSNAAHASPDTALPAATAQEIAVMQGFVVEALCSLQEEREHYWSLSEASVVAEESAVTAGTYPAVLLPADFGQFVKNGFFIQGNPVRVLTDGEWLRTRRPDNLGGGTTLTELLGTPNQTRSVLRVTPASQASASAVWRMAAFLYPLQRAAWTLECFYRATAKNYSGDTDVVRLPTRMLRLVLLFCAARCREFAGNRKGAVESWAIYRDALNEIEAIPPSAEQQATMLLVPPVDA